MRFAMSLPYFVGSEGPTDVDGTGNYVLKLRSNDVSRTHLFTIYFLDSHAYASTLFTTRYDWIKQSQIDWYEKTAQSIKPILRPFRTPDLSHEDAAFGLSTDSIPKLELDGRQHDNQTLRKPMAMAFWHIPLIEAFDEPDKEFGLPLKFGSQLEGPGSPSASHLNGAR